MSEQRYYSRNKCFARRHMTPSEYWTWDAMRHMKGKQDSDTPGVCNANLATICNHTNQSRSNVWRNIQSLLASGWLSYAPGEQRRFKDTGRMAARQYILRTDLHDHVPGCPPWMFDPQTHDQVIKRQNTNHQTLPPRCHPPHAVQVSSPARGECHPPHAVQVSSPARLGVRNREVSNRVVNLSAARGADSPTKNLSNPLGANAPKPPANQKQGWKNILEVWAKTPPQPLRKGEPCQSK